MRMVSNRLLSLLIVLMGTVSSRLSLLPPDVQQLDNDVPRTPKKIRGTERILKWDNTDGLLIVYVHKFNGIPQSQSAPEAIYPVPADQYTIVEYCSSTNPDAHEYVARLSQILPDAFKDNSPMKASSRVYHQRVNPNGLANTYLGDVAKIMQGESHVLQQVFVDNSVLDTATLPGSFICHVWCEDLETLVQVRIFHLSKCRQVLKVFTQPQEPIHAAMKPDATAATRDPPPVYIVASATAKRPTQLHVDNLSHTEQEDFIHCLRVLFVIGGSKPEWGRAKMMSVVVLHCRAILDALETLEDKGFSGGPEGGYKVPALVNSAHFNENGIEDRVITDVFKGFAGLKFTVTQVELALNIKHGVAQSDRKHFDSKTVKKFDKIAGWLKDPYTSEHSKMFDSMTAAQFKEYKEKRSDSVKVKGVLNSKKKARTLDDQEEELIRMKTKKGNAKRVASEELDDSE
ncbi:hypothetical protein HWV62_10501 [Athelia sp. TMB]|nr:hypothetical protein HWV62_10501 [Athelia sp. TMB]